MFAIKSVYIPTTSQISEDRKTIPVVSPNQRKYHKSASSALEYLDATGRNILLKARRSFFCPSKPKQVNYVRVEKLDIPNFAKVGSHGMRGESLSSPKNRKYLIAVKKSGVDTIVDLRDKYASKAFPDICSKNGFKYFNIPVDSSSVSDRKIIDNLPTLFEVMNNDSFYISCAQGLHRTDIALSLNYVFNPKAKEPPVLIGHFREGEFKFEDIARRLNSIRKALTPEDIQKFGWDDSFAEEFENRKKALKDFNMTFTESYNS